MPRPPISYDDCEWVLLPWFKHDLRFFCRAAFVFA